MTIHRFFTVLKFFVKPLVWILLLFLPLYHRNSQVSGLRGWQIFAATILIAPLMHGLTGWAGGEGLPLRAENLAIWMMGFIWTFLWGYCYNGNAAVRFAKLLALRWPLLILALVLNFNFITVAKDLVSGRAAQFAAEYDAREAEVLRQKEAGVRDIVVPLIETHSPLLFYSGLRPWDSYWANKGFAGLYGVDSVTVLPVSMCENPEAVARWRNGDVNDLEKLAESDVYKARSGGEADLTFIMGEMYDPAFAAIINQERAQTFGDATKSERWYIKAAENGNVQACRRLTRLNFHSDTPGHYLRAFYWFVRSVLPLIRP